MTICIIVDVGKQIGHKGILISKLSGRQLSLTEDCVSVLILQPNVRKYTCGNWIV